jgi:hypothetical protein
MPSIAVAFPLLPGQADEARRFAKEVEGRLAEYAESMRRLGPTRESWYLQSSPEGDLFILYMEAEDPARVFEEFAASEAPIDVWMKQRVQALTGMDMNRPPPGPLPEQVFEWQER